MMESTKLIFICSVVATAAYTVITFLRAPGYDETLHREQSRPNFVVFFADDIGWGDIGANWDKYKSVTVNLNKLAEQGMRFTDFHVGSSVCGPSRAALLTGRLGLRTGLIKNFSPLSVGGLPLSETTIAEALKTVGYRTGMIGKWHLGHTENYHPNSRGFDHYYGLPYSNDMGCVDVPAFDRPPAQPCPKAPGNVSDLGGYGWTAVPLYKNRDIVEQPVDLINLGDHYATKADEFLNGTSEQSDPFFLYVAFAHMHVPLAHAPRFSNSTDLNTVYADTLHEMDTIIGQVLSSLEKYGFNDNTMIWFAGDNGPWLSKCEYSGSPGPFLGTWLTETYGGGSTAKTTTWEAGHREPALAVFPGRITPGTVSDALVSSMDIFPTVLKYAGADMPSNRRFDGRDITDILEGRSTRGHDVLYHPNSGTTSPHGEIDTIRMGPYKVFYKTGGHGGCSSDCDGNKAPQVDHYPPIIFNVAQDPAESTPLTAETEPDYYRLVAEADALRNAIADDIKSDNTSVADFSISFDAYQCCDPTQYLCRCQRD